MLRSFLRRWLGIDDDSLVFNQRALHLSECFSDMEDDVKLLRSSAETAIRLTTETYKVYESLEKYDLSVLPLVKPKSKTKPKAKVKK